MDDRELEQKAELAELLLHAARQLGESLEPERVYERFHELLTDVVRHDGLVVSSYDERDDLIRAEYVWTEGEILDPSTLPPVPLNREGGGMQSRVIVSGEPILFNDVAERVTKPDGVYYNVDREGTIQKLPESGPAGTNAAMMVPVKDEGRVVGVVQLMSDHGAYSSKQLEVFEGLVAQMAAAVRNARLQQERRRLEAAEAAARAVAAEREQAARVLDAVGDGIFLLDRDGIIRLWNKACELLSCLPAERALGEPLDALIPEWQGARHPHFDRRGRCQGPVGDPSSSDPREGSLALVRGRAHGGRRDLRLPRRHERATAGGGEDRPRRDDLARAAHAHVCRVRRGQDAAPRGRRVPGGAAAAAPGDDRHAGRSAEPDHG